ncbi:MULTISPECIES: energy-coupling factor transporter ATPase [Staphylococcus]|uniref:Energy-coupling factor transporter ATPase n=1 Tax=Staphylococcus hsinchuensis TaxID=3051183 RepID=A0ABZ3ECX7_9STAP|nr:MULTISPECIES: energy-coupling factor transporter ATPase [unclassified Staphylococcus]
MVMDNHAIAFNHVSFKYDEDASLVLDDVSFNVPTGQWTSIVGHNGSGKSTIAKLMIGIEEPVAGTIYLNGQQLNASSVQELRKQIGIVFQNPENQFVGATVEFDVAFGLENHAVGYEKMQQIVPDVLQDVEMLDKAKYEPQSLSGGQKQRVAIAGVLALNTDIIILDEATSMLDPSGRKELLNLIRELKQHRDVTIISITHDLTEALVADHLIVMNEGKVYDAGPPQYIFKDGAQLTKIGLDLPFSMRMNQLLFNKNDFVTYERLLENL